VSWPSTGGPSTGTAGPAARAVRWASVRPIPSPVIGSARLDLRGYGAGDAGLVHALLAAGPQPDALPPGAPSDPDEVAVWLADSARAPQREGTGIHLMMLDRAADRIVGSIGLFHIDWQVRSAEIGYGVHRDERGKGYASEALGAVARWALTEGGIQRAWLTANTDNVASIRVAEKAGFRREGTLRRAGLEDDGLHDLAVFSLLDDEL
jgi:RimJ/RimL family protein N-acetyltransferase